MRPVALAAVALASCCAPAKNPGLAQCITPCGMHGPLSLDCEELVRFETLAIKRLGETEGLTASMVCSAVKGWAIEVRQPSGETGCEGGWREGVICVLGFTHIKTRVMSFVWPAKHPNVLAHEMVHVVDYSMRGYPGHCGWGRRGVGRALLEITGEVDKSVDSDCEPAQKLDGGL